jgi:hypothetical protein
LAVVAVEEIIQQPQQILAVAQASRAALFLAVLVARLADCILLHLLLVLWLTAVQQAQILVVAVAVDYLLDQQVLVMVAQAVQVTH